MFPLNIPNKCGTKRQILNNSIHNKEIIIKPINFKSIGPRPIDRYDLPDGLYKIKNSKQTVHLVNGVIEGKARNMQFQQGALISYTSENRKLSFTHGFLHGPFIVDTVSGTYNRGVLDGEIIDIRPEYQLVGNTDRKLLIAEPYISFPNINDNKKRWTGYLTLTAKNKDILLYHYDRNGNLDGIQTEYLPRDLYAMNPIYVAQSRQGLGSVFIDDNSLVRLERYFVANKELNYQQYTKYISGTINILSDITGLPTTISDIVLQYLNLSPFDKAIPRFDYEYELLTIPKGSIKVNKLTRVFIGPNFVDSDPDQGLYGPIINRKYPLNNDVTVLINLVEGKEPFQIDIDLSQNTPFNNWAILMNDRWNNLMGRLLQWHNEYDLKLDALNRVGALLTPDRVLLRTNRANNYNPLVPGKFTEEYGSLYYVNMKLVILTDVKLRDR